MTNLSSLGKEIIRKKWLKIGLILLALSMVFVMDDLLLLLLINELRIWNIPGYVLLLGGFILILLNLSLAWVGYKALRRQPSTGGEGMIGKRGIAIANFKGEGQVRITGEIWDAECDEPIRKNDRVEVIGLSGLKLKIRKMTR